MNIGGMFVYGLYKVDGIGTHLPNTAYLDEEIAYKACESINTERPDEHWDVKTIWVPRLDAHKPQE